MPFMGISTVTSPLPSAAFVAIAASVKDRVVTLRGSVGDPALRDRAAELARETAGVDAVESRIEVRAAEAPAKRSAGESAKGSGTG